MVFSIFSKGDHNQIRSIMDSTLTTAAQEALSCLIIYRRKIQFFRRRMICVVVSNAYCTNLWGTFLCQNTKWYPYLGQNICRTKKSVCMLLHYHHKYRRIYILEVVLRKYFGSSNGGTYFGWPKIELFSKSTLFPFVKIICIRLIAVAMAVNLYLPNVKCCLVGWVDGHTMYNLNFPKKTPRKMLFLRAFGEIIPGLLLLAPN